MRKYLFLTILFCSTLVFGQNKYFELTPCGFRSVTDSTKNYIVLNFPDKTKEDLYKEVLAWTNKNYGSGENTIRTINNENISINSISYNDIKVASNAAIYCHMEYQLNISFKDDKIKIDAPIFELTPKVLLRCDKGKSNGFFGQYCFYQFVNNSYEAKRYAYGINCINDFFNKKTDSIKTQIETKNGTDDNW